MNDPFEKLAQLRTLYPDDIKQIEEQEEALRALLQCKEYAANPETQKLMALCRSDITFARIKLATTRSLTDEARAELWRIIDARHWFLHQVANDYDAEIAALDAALTSDLERVQ